MGLAGPKNRTKISRDPNNTAWARSTDTFGHKILTSQGWTPGDSLGAKDAAHASHYTAASHSHIRVAIKDDTLGLGMNHAKERAETFGLGLFQGILGRLNGKDEAVLKKEEEHRGNLERVLYAERKFGGLNFVRGGFLVGDRIEDALPLADKATVDTALPLVEVSAASADSGEEGKRSSKKRKLEATDDAELETTGKKLKKEKSKKKRKTAEEIVADASAATDIASSTAPSQLTSAASTRSSSPASEEKAEKKRRKEERRARKEAKRIEKEQKRSEKEQKRLRKEQKRAVKSESTSEFSADEADETSKDNGYREVAVVKETAASVPKPMVSFSGGRHAVRQRYIQSKKMASMDTQALKEIFMMKA